MKLALHQALRLVQANGFLVFSLLASGVLGLLFLDYQKLSGTNFVWDARGYLDLGYQYGRAILGRADFPSDELRTTAYPILVLATVFFGSKIGLDEAQSIFCVHLTFWWFAIVYSYRAMGKVRPPQTAADTSETKSPSISQKVLVSLLGMNFYISPYLSVGLADSIYISLTVVFLSWITLLLQSPKNWTSRIPFGIFVVSLALVIRPAAIWLFIVLVVAIFYLISNKAFESISSRDSRLFPRLFLGMSPILVQSTIQYIKFGSFTPLPVFDLAKFQIISGIQNVKYGTWLGSYGPQNFYSSDQLIGPQSPEGGSWYLENPLQALKLIAVKFVGAFDYDYLVPYPSSQPLFPWLYSILSLGVLAMGCAAIAVHLVWPFSHLGPKWLPLLILVSWGSIHLLSAIELRFSLPMLIYLSVVSSLLVVRVWKQKNIGLIWVSVFGFSALLACLLLVASFVRGLSDIR